MNERKFANTLARGLSVLRAFRVSDDGLTHSEIVARTGLAPATVTRLTYTLVSLGYLSQQAGLFRLGPSSLALASVAVSATSFVDLADAQMTALAEKTRTLILMAVRDGASMSFVRTWRPAGVSADWLHAGNRVPIAGSSTGQAFIAGLSQEQFDALQPNEKLRLQRQSGMEQLARRGFTFVSGARRFAATVNAVARPYHAGNFGAPVVFVAGAEPEALSDERIITEVGPALRETVRDLERTTGSHLSLERSGEQESL